MKINKIINLLLFMGILICILYIAGCEINSAVEKTITDNFKSEIDALKEKVNSQAELINSLINIKDKEDLENETNVDNSVNSSAEQIKEFSYIIENGGVTITKYNGSKTSVQIPNQIEQLPVLKIGRNAFAESKVRSVTLPSSCKEVDWFAFYGCFALTTIYISNDVTNIGYGAFDSCSKSLTIYCEKNSYAQKYAQSFGIKYSNFQ